MLPGLNRNNKYPSRRTAMRISLACLLALVALPAGVLAQDAPVNKQVHDARRSREHYRQPVTGP
jgi:hypothetical protein